VVSRFRLILMAWLVAERTRWALWLPVCLAIGVGGYFSLPWEPPLHAGALVTIGAVLAGLVFRRRGGAVLVLAIAPAAMGAGFSIAQFRTVIVDAPILAKRIGPTMMEGRVLHVQPLEKGYRLVLDRLSIPRLSADQLPERARVRLRSSPRAISPGDVVRLRAILSPPPSPAAPGAFDFARRAYFQRIGAVGFALGKPRIVSRAPDGMSWRVWIGKLRNNFTERVLDSLGGAKGAIAAALMTGERGTIPEDVLVAMREAGLAHLLAISGLHVGLVAGILLFSLRLGFASIGGLALRYPVKKWAAAIALIGAFCYLLISGSTVPTQRAFMMLAVVMAAIMLDRNALSMRVVAFAASLVLLIAPESLLGASFQLSFAAVVALIAAYETLGHRFAGWRADSGRARRIGLYVLGVAFTTLIAGTATAPFAAYHFNRVALYGVAANLIAIPLTGFWIMPWAVAAFALMPFGLEGLALAPMGLGIDAVITVARTVSGWPGASMLLSSMPTVGIILVAFGGLWLCLWRETWRWAGVALIAAGLVTIPFQRGPDILIDGAGRLMAVRSDAGELALSTRKAARFEGKIWLRRSGQQAPGEWPGEGGDGRLACDSLGCIFHIGGRIVALVLDEAALDEDCFQAGVVVSRVPVRRWRCRHPDRVIDRFDLWRRGAHALWISDDGIRVESVAGIRGIRPWSPARKPTRRKPDRTNNPR
jgi:competence protein ComEC